MESEELKEIKKAVEEAISIDIKKIIKDAVETEITESNKKVLDKAESLKKYLRGERSLISRVETWLKTNWIIIGIIGVFGFAIFAYVRNDIAITDNSLIISFIGILATFIVVSNYMQVKETEREFERKSNKIKEDCLNEINKLSKRNTSIDRLDLINELYFSINEAQFYYILKEYTKSYVNYLHALDYLYEINNDDYFKYDVELSELLNMLFKHKENIEISKIRKASDIKLINSINNNNGLKKYIEIIEGLPEKE